MSHRQQYPALLLLPGMLCDARLWSPVTEALGQHGVPVHIGDITAGASVEAIAAAVMARAPARFAVAGLSMGGIVAFELWRQAPQRIAGMALLDTNPAPESAERRQMRRHQLERVAAEGLQPVVVEELKPGYLGSKVHDPTTLKALIVDMALTLGPAVFRRQCLALQGRPNSWPTLASIAVPALVLCGAQDTLCPPALHAEMAAALPDARSVTLPDCGHLASLERPTEVTAAMLDWLGAVTRAATQT